VGKAKKFGIGVVAFLAFIITLGLVAFITFDGGASQTTVVDPDYEPASFGEVRNCIKRVMSDTPDCSDTSSRILPTTCNGRDIGQISYSQAISSCS